MLLLDEVGLEARHLRARVLGGTGAPQRHGVAGRVVVERANAERDQEGARVAEARLEAVPEQRRHAVKSMARGVVPHRESLHHRLVAEGWQPEEESVGRHAVERVRRDDLMAKLGFGVVAEPWGAAVEHLLRIQDQGAPVDELGGVPDVAEEVDAPQRRDHRFAERRQLVQASHVGEVRAGQRDRECDAHMAELVGAAREERGPGARTVERGPPRGELAEEPGIGPQRLVRREVVVDLVRAEERDLDAGTLGARREERRRGSRPSARSPRSAGRAPARTRCRRRCPDARPRDRRPPATRARSYRAAARRTNSPSGLARPASSASGTSWPDASLVPRRTRALRASCEGKFEPAHVTARRIAGRGAPGTIGVELRRLSRRAAAGPRPRPRGRHPSKLRTASRARRRGWAQSDPGWRDACARSARRRDRQ